VDKLKDTDTFIGELIRTFPELQDEVQDEDYAGLIAMQISCFTRLTQKAIDAGNWDLVVKCFSFIAGIFNSIEYKIQNAIVISYIGKLNISENCKAELLMPSEFKNIRNNLELYYNTSSTNDSVKTFLKNL